MTICEATDFIFPLQADVYYAMTESSAYGNAVKTWVLDKTVACSLQQSDSQGKQNNRVVQSVITESETLVGRLRSDIRVSDRDVANAFSNTIVTNIRDVNGNHIYVETSGPRAGKSTIFEIATQSPFVNPFGDVEHYSIVLRRSENQGVDV